MAWQPVETQAVLLQGATPQGIDSKIGRKTGQKAQARLVNNRMAIAMSTAAITVRMMFV